MDNKKAKKILILILFMIFSIIQLYSIGDYCRKYSSRYEYKDFMHNIRYYIYKNGLNENYHDELQKVFGVYTDNSGLANGMDILITLIVQGLIGILTIVGIILNCISLNLNKKIFAQTFLFIYIIIVGCFNLYIAIFEEKTKINLTDAELEEFKEMRRVIEKNLDSVKTRVLYLTVYSALLIVTSIAHIIVNVYIIKQNKKLDFVNYRENIINNPIIENNLLNNWILLELKEDQYFT